LIAVAAASAAISLEPFDISQTTPKIEFGGHRNFDDHINRGEQTWQINHPADGPAP
jgi:hypothetical protein